MICNSKEFSLKVTKDCLHTIHQLITIYLMLKVVNSIMRSSKKFCFIITLVLGVLVESNTIRKVQKSIENYEIFEKNCFFVSVRESTISTTWKIKGTLEVLSKKFHWGQPRTSNAGIKRKSNQIFRPLIFRTMFSASTFRSFVCLEVDFQSVRQSSKCQEN